MEIPSVTPPAGDFPGKVPAALHGAAGQPGQGRLGVVGMNCGQRAAVAGVEGLEEIGGLAAPDLTHHDMVRTVPQGVFDQIADRHRSAVDAPRLEADAVGMIDPKFQRVLD